MAAERLYRKKYQPTWDLEGNAQRLHQTITQGLRKSQRRLKDRQCLYEKSVRKVWERNACVRNPREMDTPANFLLGRCPVATGNWSWELEPGIRNWELEPGTGTGDWNWELEQGADNWNWELATGN